MRLVTLECQRCGAKPELQSGTVLFTTGKEAIRQARNAGWLITKDKMLCPDCELFEFLRDA